MTATGADGGWVAYSSETARLACRHPRSWGRAENVLGATVVLVDGNAEWDEHEGFRPNVTIGVEPRDADLDDELFERHAASPPTYLTDPILLDREIVHVAGVPAQRLLVVYRRGPRTLTLEQWCLAAPGRAIYVSGATTTNQFADVQPVVEAIVDTTLRLELRLGGVSVTGEGWLDRDQAVLGLPESADDDAAVRLLCFPTVRLAHTLAGFLDLGPRPSPEDLGALLVKPAALERLLGSGVSPEQARAELESDDAAADGALAALCGRGTLHWRLELHDAPSAGMTFSRRTEAVDAGADGLWLSGPSADEDLVLVVPATTTKLWRLVTTMLPTQEETVAILAACKIPHERPEPLIEGGLLGGSR